MASSLPARRRLLQAAYRAPLVRRAEFRPTSPSLRLWRQGPVRGRGRPSRSIKRAAASDWKADLAYRSGGRRKRGQRRFTREKATSLASYYLRRAVLHRSDAERQRNRAGLILGRLVKPRRIGYSSVQNRVGGSGMKYPEKMTRRSVLGVAAAGAAGFVSPWRVRSAAAAEPIKIGAPL